jgi:tetratricopeptide (TPR) repeat protein
MLQGLCKLAISTALAMSATVLSAQANQKAPPEAAKKAQAKKNAAGHPSVKPHQPPKPNANKKRLPGVRGMFQVAQEYYEAGKFNQALAAYDALLRKYPGHEPALLQLAKTLYRLDRIKDAYGVFAKINPQDFDAETAYEYGWSFYTNKTWEGALYGFQRVPKGHALFDLANYYGAICAIKLKKYEDAEDMLEKAVVLPDKLAKSRSLYVKHVQALRLLQQKTTLAKERDNERQSLKDQNPVIGKKDIKPESVVDNIWVHTGSKTITRAAKVKYNIEHQYIDKHGLEETSYDTKVASIEVKSGAITPIPFNAGKERVTALGLQLSLIAKDKISKGEKQRILIDESNEDLARLSQDDLGTTDYKSGIFEVNPFVEIPLPENTWLALGGDISFTYPEFERGSRTGYRAGYASLTGTLPLYKWSTKGFYSETLDSDTKPTISSSGATASISGELIKELNGKLTVRHEIYDYLVDELKIVGPDTRTTLDLKVTQILPYGSEISVLGSYANLGNYIFYKIPTYGQLSANGREVTTIISAGTSPVPWFSLSLDQMFVKTYWEQENADAQDVFERNVPDYIEQFNVSVSINMFY